jgi:DNA-directed RNA polymerase subunit RPC12/RpoP
MGDNKPGWTVITLEAVLPPRPTTPVPTSPTLPCMKGNGHRNYACPGCRRTVLAGIEANQIEKSAIFKCPQCGTHSRMPFGR